MDAIAQQYLNETRWLEFKELEGKKNAKTKCYEVISKCSDVILGEIKWYCSWRAYCFFPATIVETVFSDRCQLQIGYFIMKLNEEHKENKE